MRVDYDDYEDYDNPNYRWMSIVVLLFAVAGFFSLAWYAYYTGTRQLSSDDVVVIQADHSPVKVVPENRGGAQFPHQEKTIYEAMTPQKDRANQAVRLLPQPEMPVIDERATRPAVRESAKTKTIELIQQAAQPAKKVEAPKPKAAIAMPDPFDPVKEKDKAVSWSKPVETKQEAPKPKVVEKAKPKPAPVKKVATVSGPKIQLAATRSNSEAQGLWKKVQGSHADLLGNMKHVVERADLGAKGVFYRVKIVGFQTKSKAVNVCNELKKRGQSCFVTQ